MYTKPTVYRAFSIYRLVTGILSFLSAITVSIIYSGIGTSGKLFGLPMSAFLPSEAVSAITVFFWVIAVFLILSSMVSLFFCYMDFSSMFQFADLIEHDLRGINAPIRKRSFVLPPKAYKGFGTVIFTIYFIIGMLTSIVLIIAKSITNKVFVAMPLIPLGITALYIFIIYITYALRYKAFGDVLEVAMEPDQQNPSATVKESLKENKTGILRGWCTALFVLCIVYTIVSIVSIVLCACYLPRPLNTILIIPIVISWITTVITFAVIGCFFDNLAMMVERKLIKYNLIKSSL